MEGGRKSANGPGSRRSRADVHIMSWWSPEDVGLRTHEFLVPGGLM